MWLFDQPISKVNERVDEMRSYGKMFAISTRHVGGNGKMRIAVGLVTSIFLIVLLFPLSSYSADEEAQRARHVYDKNLHNFQPPPDGSGIILTYGSEPLKWLGLHYGLVTDYSRGHVTFVMTDGSEDAIIKNQVATELLFGVGITKFFNVGVAVPYIVWRDYNNTYDIEVPVPENQQGGTNGQQAETETRKYKLEELKSNIFEDLRVDAKGIILNRRERCIGVAINVTATIPVEPVENNFSSDMNPTVTPRLIVDVGKRRWNAALNAGYKFYTSKPDPDESDLGMEVKDEVVFGLGGKLRITYKNEVMVDSILKTYVEDFFTEDKYNYGEVIAAYRRLFGNYSFFALTIGGGMGIAEGAGTPAARAFIGLTSYESRLEF